MRAAILDALSKLVGCNTTNPPRLIHESGIIGVVQAMLETAGCTVSVQDLGEGRVNCLAVRGNPTMLFNVHLDTVPVSEGWTTDPFTLTVTNDRASALGACDIKGAAACLLTAIQHSDGDVGVLFSTDEEAGGSQCIASFLETVPGWVQGVVVAEPTHCKGVRTHRGLMTCEGIFKGVAGHGSAARSDARSAIHDAGAWITASLDQASTYDSLSCDELAGIRFNIGIVEGGSKANVIASNARVVFDLRPLPTQDAQDVSANLFDSNGAGATATWRTRFTAPPLVRTSASDVFFHALGLDAGPAVDFWTEAALFCAAGLPAIVFGPGDIGQAHAPDEWVLLAELDEATATYIRIIQEGFNGFDTGHPDQSAAQSCFTS